MTFQTILGYFNFISHYVPWDKAIGFETLGVGHKHNLGTVWRGIVGGSRYRGKVEQKKKSF